MCYFNRSHSASLKPTRTKSSPMMRGRFTSMPLVESSSICSSSLISGSLSFSCISLYSIPLVLKNFFRGRPLFSHQVFSSSAVGFCSTMCLSSKATPFPSNHALAFLQVVHLGYSKNKTLIFILPFHDICVVEVKRYFHLLTLVSYLFHYKLSVFFPQGLLSF